MRARTGRDPILYTARSWWREHGIDEAKVSQLGVVVWIADYSASHKASEEPATLNGEAKLTESSQAFERITTASDAIDAGMSPELVLRGK